MDEARFAPPKALVADVGDVVDAARRDIDLQTQSTRTRWAANACLVFALCLFYRLGGMRITVVPGLVQVLFVLTMALGIYLRSRLCAVLVTADFALCAAFWLRVSANPVFVLACIAIGGVLMLGTVSAFKYHRLLGS